MNQNAADSGSPRDSVCSETALKVLDEHYFKHPLAQIDQKHDGNAALRKVTLDIELDTSEDDWEDLEA